MVGTIGAQVLESVVGPDSRIIAATKDPRISSEVHCF